MSTMHMGSETPIPGTQQLIDLNYGKNATENGMITGTSEKDIHLLPRPSSDPDDPLRWKKGRKLLCTFCICLYVGITGIAASNVYSVLVPFSKDSGLPVATINAGTGYIFLLGGWGLFFWQPFALQYGKRPVYLISMFAVTAMSIWAPFCTTSGQWYARSIISGFFLAPAEALPEIGVADLWFSHQRGTYMSLYAFVLLGSNFFAPIIFGYINDGQNWTWVFWYPAIFCGAAFVFLFLFMEETNYDRVSTPYQNIQESKNTLAKDDITREVITVDQVYLAASSKKTFLQKMALKDKPRPFMIFERLKLQVRFLTFPIPLFAGFAYGSILIWFNVLNATASLILGAPPYNFSSSNVGLSYLAPCIGVCIGFLSTGRVSDWLALRLARRHGGIFEPEMRLWLFAANVVLVPCALILWGVGAAHHVFWFGLLVGMAVLGAALVCGATLSVTYLVDCYHEMSGDAMTAVIVVRNTMGFAIGYGITPWIDGLGLQNTFISAACVAFVASLPFLVMLKWGKQMRARSKQRYWKLVRESKARGVRD